MPPSPSGFIGGAGARFSRGGQIADAIVPGRDGTIILPPDQPAGLLEKLEELSDHFPEKQRQEFKKQDLLLRMETLRRRLKGGKGLRNKVGTTAKPSSKTKLSSSNIAKSFNFLKGLTGALPDTRIGLALSEKISHIVEKVRRLPDG